VKRKKCARCGSTAFRRINRVRFMERVLLPWLGFYPWECAVCRRKTFRRTNGHRDMKRRPATWNE
jgi:hypothetical protein